jgi:hypothetical protein
MQIMFNWPALALAVLVGLFILGLWYSPFAWGPLLQRREGLDEAGAKAAMLPRLGASLALVVLQALALGGAFNFTGSNTFGMGVLAAFQLWLGFSAPVLILAVLPPRRDAKLLLVHAGGSLLAALLQGGLLASWR